MLQPWETGRYVANVPTTMSEVSIILPRLGLAYRVTDKTVLRTGFGFYSNEPSVTMIQSLGQNPRPNALAVSYISDPAIPQSDALEIRSARQPRCRAGRCRAPSRSSGRCRSSSPTGWGMSIQRGGNSGTDTALDLGYQGSHFIHELMVTSYNDAVPGTEPRQSRRPYPGFQNINLVTANGDIKYNGLEVKLERRDGANGLSGLLAYTWAKALDTVGGRAGDPRRSRPGSRATRRWRITAAWARPTYPSALYHNAGVRIPLRSRQAFSGKRRSGQNPWRLGLLWRPDRTRRVLVNAGLQRGPVGRREHGFEPARLRAQP